MGMQSVTVDDINTSYLLHPKTNLLEVFFMRQLQQLLCLSIKYYKLLTATLILQQYCSFNVLFSPQISAQLVNKNKVTCFNIQICECEVKVSQLEAVVMSFYCFVQMIKCKIETTYWFKPSKITVYSPSLPSAVCGKKSLYVQPMLFMQVKVEGELWCSA